MKIFSLILFAVFLFPQAWSQDEIPSEYSHLATTNGYVEGYFWLDLPHRSELNANGNYYSTFTLVLVNNDDIGSILQVLEEREDVIDVRMVEDNGNFQITIEATEPIQNKRWAQAIIVDIGLRKVRFNNGSYSVFEYLSGYRTELKKTW